MECGLGTGLWEPGCLARKLTKCGGKTFGERHPMMPIAEPRASRSAME